MKNMSWIWAILMPIIGFLIPALADPDIVLEGLTTAAGYVGLITIITEGLKPLLKKWQDFKYFAEGLSLVVAIVLGYGGFLFEYGIFMYATWYYTLGLVLIGWAVSNRWYDLSFKLIK